ncbi:MAG: hypothetical protein HQ507_11725 [Candidatus Marinimicrobia bacterium]|nr:hypothetical protein [Candidatus Neomarinimicrobiota bacterium]
MPTQSAILPSPREIGDRILHNLKRVQGYLDVLQSELDDPQKIGTGEVRADYARLTQELSKNLIQLEEVLVLKPWNQPIE